MTYIDGEGARDEALEYRGFASAAGAEGSETVVMSRVEWPSKGARDAGMVKVTSDPRIRFREVTP